MTREEILNMPAGEEFDDLIAEKFFPEKVGHSRYQKFNPTSDVAAAWEVFVALGDVWSIKQLKNIYICLNDENWNNGILVQADTAPLAICRAALLAVAETE